ncbi:hypothetical protein SDJN02_03532 [Cucurbita argyrosperma subsp. argyrosperma]|uniref:Uncharacterized protein LOC111453382 isoform X2 n=1 Tax=Cucurbita moschata TaxID=3662 RepID=A0A6J1GF76_CUCMO|nr:uncharacterized protein LOC111453382 isoform X2 [Cucurbita moschata]KAG7033807.1 hypothetical protein SDJN02_03532 [Cucurbita argyrosperma subsp. argyrosperma]
MEGKKHVGAESESESSSSRTTDPFGSKHSSYSSTTGIFGSIFAPSSKVLGRDSLLSQAKEGERDSVNGPWIPNAEAQDDNGSHRQKERQEKKDKDMSSIYQEQGAQPCHLSSSIYYGGQDVYAHPQNSHNFEFKEGGEDDSGSASRGNWWQGSLYY